MTTGAPVIHVVDDDRLFRTAVARVLRTSGYHVVLYKCASQLIDAPASVEPGCILLDVRMPGTNGPELQARLAERQNPLPIVFVTGYGDIPTSVCAIKAGAEDFLLKPVSKKTLLAAVERALARYRVRAERNERLDRMRMLLSTLTPREREVFDLLVRGKPHKQIAYEFGTAERTIKAHRHVIMEKLKVRSLAEAVSIAERVGLLAAPEGTGG
jgi:RNA polymerase sigma factor (sigma-70 family)